MDKPFASPRFKVLFCSAFYKRDRFFCFNLYKAYNHIIWLELSTPEYWNSFSASDSPGLLFIRKYHSGSYWKCYAKRFEVPCLSGQTRTLIDSRVLSTRLPCDALSHITFQVQSTTCTLVHIQCKEIKVNYRFRIVMCLWFNILIYSVKIHI